MENFISTVKGFFAKIRNFKNIFNFKLKKLEEPVYKDNRFQKYLEGLDILDPSYDIIKEAIEFCQQSMYFSERRIYLGDKLQGLVLKESDLEILNTLQKEDFHKLQNYIDAYKTVERETGTLKNQVNSYDKSLDYFSKFEQEIEPVIKEMEYYEKRQASLKRDMAYISGEKEELIYSKQQLEQGLDFLYKFSIVLVCVLAIVTFTMGVLKIAYKIQVFVPLIILSVFTIILGSAVYIFQRKFRYELHRNALLQVRAVELLNRAKVLYANCTTFLNFEYKKFRVRNSSMLKNNWDEYMYQKQIARRHIAMNNRMQEVLNSITNMLTNKGMHDVENLFEDLLNLLTLEDRKVLYRSIKDERKNIEKELDDLDIKQEKIWGQLIDLQQKDTTEDNIISHIMQAYEEETENLISKLGEK